MAPAFGSHDDEFVLLSGLPGINFAERSEWSVSADLAAKRLVRVLPDWNLLDADIVTILNPRTIRTVRAEALLQDLISAFSGRGWGKPAPKWCLDQGGDPLDSDGMTRLSPPLSEQDFNLV